jgi:capsular polysaccharide biosynthesis protein
MSQQAMDLRKSTQIVRRHKIVFGVVALLGILAGGAYARLHPPMVTSTALVVLPTPPQGAAAAPADGAPDPYTATQEVIAGSNQVLSAALPHVRPAMSLPELHSHIQIGSLTPYVISISAQGTSAADVEATTDAVAESYVQYVNSASNAAEHVSAELLQKALTTTAAKPLQDLIVDASLGAIFGALVGAVIALAMGRSDRRLRERDEIADAIGVPVLASFPVAHPNGAAGWTKLLGDYQPEARHALQMRKALQHLGVATLQASNGNGHGESGTSSVTILSLASDPGALAVGPQLAAFAAAQGIPTVLVIGPQQDPDVAASLRTACAAPPPSSSKWPSHLRVAVSDDGDHTRPDGELTVVVAVVESRSPKMPDVMQTAATVLGVSSGAATAEQLARVAISADASGRGITGFLIANPEPTDHTTGRAPQVSRPLQRRLPTRLAGMTTEIRR